MAFSFKSFFGGADDEEEEYEDSGYEQQPNQGQQQPVNSQQQNTSNQSYSGYNNQNQNRNGFAYDNGYRQQPKMSAVNSSTQSANNSAKIDSHIALFVPKVFSDAKTIVNQLLLHEAVIVNFSAIDETQSAKIVDFVAGAIYAVEGSIEKISDEIWLIAPNNYAVSGSGSAANSMGRNARF
ncbi:cell division protein SepF [Oenococcus oeni]|uniref:Cell division protein SepF n=1 Tax=Oenococcus oeni (strain ATCC BAA-331 / PSU-1) TaxID=203123 RepID=SEPF_OENOB|nr:cell division protein SepF [Oenococcus oeni]Q04ET4.1 RecName: Full=Cell division protein SepF [Oenococcus oeni PSU-1]ABJ57038.1 Cell division protein [Oenococcus oeni PSU-1]OIK67991.1 cell division protein SepF [Oenococcus oeni]OIL14555.1 cell division protein SepF [Oenococcus oeni]OIL28650.1 cell division protein SepF [Oenococcus oeni]OIL81301.1 cell division protein SepF [Oenococcus oeni]